MIGQRLGNYQILEELGRGGMGIVYRASDLMLPRQVAIKVLNRDVARDPTLVERFRSEAVCQSVLHHPNIVTLYSFERGADDNLYMVMEFVPGTTLADEIRRERAMRLDYALPLFRQVLDGIEHAHSAGVVHRDIKPSNVLLTRFRVAKITDFGIARLLGSSGLTRTGNVIGTFEYMSPERVRGSETNVRSDIYSLGVVFYEMLAGRVPFTGASDFEIMSAHVNTPPAPPSNIVPGIPEEIDAAILRALAKDPRARFANVHDFKAAIFGETVTVEHGKPTKLYIPPVADSGWRSRLSLMVSRLRFQALRPYFRQLTWIHYYAIGFGLIIALFVWLLATTEPKGPVPSVTRSPVSQPVGSMAPLPPATVSPVSVSQSAPQSPAAVTVPAPPPPKPKPRPEEGPPSTRKQILDALR